MDNESVANGASKVVNAYTDVVITIEPNAGYHIKSVKLGETDVTSQLDKNQLKITSISEDKALSVAFEKDVLVTHVIKINFDRSKHWISCEKHSVK